MAKIYESEDNEFPLSPYGHTPFLTSVRDFENSDGEKWNEVGIDLGVEKVGNVFSSQQGKAQMVIEFVVRDDMPKVRQYVVGKDNKHVVEIDDLTGDNRKKIIIGEIKKEDQAIVPFFFGCGKPKEVSNEAELTFFPSSSAYPLFKKALIQNGDLPENMGKKAFITTQEELADALEGKIVTCKVQTVTGDITYNRLIPISIQ